MESSPFIDDSVHKNGIGSNMGSVHVNWLHHAVETVDEVIQFLQDSFNDTKYVICVSFQKNGLLKKEESAPLRLNSVAPLASNQDKYWPRQVPRVFP